MISIESNGDYHHYILNQSIDFSNSKTYIEDKHLLLSISASLRSNNFVVISELKELEVDLKQMKSKQLHICEDYLSINISLKNKLKNQPNLSEVKNLLNLKTYFKTLF